MAYREFVDDDGSVWKVWDVKPEPRFTPGRILDAGSSAALAEDGPRHVAPGWGLGWLAFQSQEASRRLRPIPNGWETTGEYSLRDYLRHAAAVRARVQLVVSAAHAADPREALSRNGCRVPRDGLAVALHWHPIRNPVPP